MGANRLGRELSGLWDNYVAAQYSKVWPSGLSCGRSPKHCTICRTLFVNLLTYYLYEESLQTTACRVILMLVPEVSGSS